MRRPALRPTWAIALLFLANGVAAPSLLPRIPDLKDAVGASDATLGLALLGTGLGGLVGVGLAPRVTAWFRADRVARWTGVAVAGGVLLVAVAPSVPTLFVAFGLLGLADGTADTAMNHLLFDAQRGGVRSLASRMHAVWSVGAVVGTGLGTVAAGIGTSVLVQSLVAAAIATACVVVARPPAPRPPSDGPEADGPLVDAPPAAGQLASSPAAVPAVTGGRPRRGSGWLLVVVAGSAVAVVEVVANDWSALTLRDGLGASAALAGAGPTAFAVAMLVGRLLGDRWIDRWGAATVARLGGAAVALGAGTGLVGAAVTDLPAFLVGGLTVAGVGTATLFPLMLAAGDRLDPSGRGVAIASFAARAGFLAVPIVVGPVGEWVGLEVAFGLLPVAGFVTALALPAALTGRRTGSSQDRPA